MTTTCPRRVLFVVLLLAAVSCNTGSSPSQRVRDYFNYLDRQDVDGWVNVMSTDSINRLLKDAAIKNASLAELKVAMKREMETSKTKSGGLKSLEILSEDVLKDVAQVLVKVQYQSEQRPRGFKIHLVKEDAQWKIADRDSLDLNNPTGLQIRVSPQ